MSRTVTLLLAEKDCFEIPGQARTGIRRIASEIALFMDDALGNGRSPVPNGCLRVHNGCLPVRADARPCPTGVRPFLTGVCLL